MCHYIIIKRVLIKLGRECIFEFYILQTCRYFLCRKTIIFYFNNIFKVKMENDVIYYQIYLLLRFVDDIYSRRKLGNNVFSDQLDNYHETIKLTIEMNPIKLSFNAAYKFSVFWINTKLFSPWTSKTPNRCKWNTFNDDLHRSKESNQTLTKEFLWQKKTLWRLTPYYVLLTV